MAVLDKVGDQFGELIKNLVIGNTRKARLRSELVRNDPTETSLKYQLLIEDMAKEQAMKSGVTNLPSVFPGIGTLISFWMVGAENFLVLDQCVTLIMTLLNLHDKADDEKEVQERVMLIIGEAFKLLDEDCKTEDTDACHAVTTRYVTRELPQKYANVGVNRLMKRLFPYRKGFRLLPIVGVMISAYDGYEVIQRVGQTTLKHLRK